MVETDSLETRNTTDFYTSYYLPSGHVLFVAHSTDKNGKELTLANKELMMGSTFSGAITAGREKIRKNECKRFTVQTMDVVKDVPDTGMLMLMVM